MALIKCKECGKEISDKAEFCPNCGYTLNSFETKHEIKQKKNIKKTGTILCVIGSSLLIVFMIILFIAANVQDNTKDQTNIDTKKADFNVHVTVGEEKETNSEILAISYYGSALISLVILILGILDLRNKIKKIGLYGWTTLILSLISLTLIFISLNCCQIVFIFFPLICLIGSIMILIGNMKEKRNALQGNY